MKSLGHYLFISFLLITSAQSETVIRHGEIRPFYGPDDLNLDPEKVVVAIDVYGDENRVVNGVLFETDKQSHSNVKVVASNAIDGWASKPNYTGIDQKSVDNLEEIMRDIRWEAAPKALEIEVSKLQPGIEYELQMLFNEGADRDRRWDIALEGELMVDDFSSEGEGTWSSSNGFAYIVPFTLENGDGTLNVTMAKHLGGQSSNGSDNNPIIQAFTVTELTVPPSPESISITGYQFFSGQVQSIGKLVSEDFKRNANHLYSLVPGEGDSDNLKFDIQDGEIFLSKDHDFKRHQFLTKFSIRVRSTDSEEPGRFLEEVFILQLDEPKQPDNLIFSSSSVSSGIIVDGLVGKIEVSDSNSFDQHIISLVAGEGDDNNDLLYVDSSNIRLKSPIRSDESELIFRIQAMDITGLIFEKSFTLKVTEPSIRINEFMASNGNTLKDDDGESSDWIELYNEQTGTLNLDGWFLSDDADQLRKWKFPSVNIPANGYLIIFASGKNRSLENKRLHANFELSSSGESILLIKPDGETIADIIEFPQQRVDVSYGYNVEATETGYLQEPSPSQKNARTAAKITNNVVFSHERGYYKDPIELELGSTVPDSEIRFTTNGAEPTNRSPIYEGPIQLSPSSSSGTRGVRTVRAVAFNSSVAVSPISTHTYIWINGTSDPNANGVIGQARFSSSIKNHPKYGSLMDDGLLSLPAISITKRGGMSGSEGEATLELISNDGTEQGFGIGCGMKIVGGASVGSAKNNFRCYFRSRYGSSKLRYPLFKGHPYSTKASDTFDVIQLRSGSHDNFYWMANPGNPPGRKRQGDAQYVRNRWVSDMEMIMGHPSLHGRFVHCYLNGSYHGLYHIHERPMHNYMDKYFGGDAEDYHYTNSGRNGSNHGAGDDWNDVWRSVKLAASQGGIESKSWINWPHLADNQLLYFYCGNDWDWTTTHNWMAAGPKYPGRGGWRFYSWDCDVMLYDVEANNLGVGAPDGIFTAMMRDEEFRIFFKDRIYKHCFNDGVLSPNGPRPYHDYRMNEIFDAIVPETARWQPSSGRNLPWDRDDEWIKEWNFMKEVFWPERTKNILNQLRNRGWYDIEAPEYEKNIELLEPGYKPIISSEDGDIFVTYDGTDPRLLGGNINPNAVFISGGTEQVNLVNKESLWKYLDDGSDQGEDWRLSEFDDSLWKEGFAELGYGDGRNGAEGTVVSYGDSGSKKFVTTYFRKKFNLIEPKELLGARISVRKDDGVVIYLNGLEVWRVSMPEGFISYDTLAIDGVGGAEETIFIDKDNIPLELFRKGENTIAVEIHQVSRTSSDISFDLELVATKASEPSKFSIDVSSRLKARVLKDNKWSALSESVFRVGVPPTSNNLVISELHYRPFPSNDIEDLEGRFSRSDFEFIELTNISDDSIDCSELLLSEGVIFDFSKSHFLGLRPNESVVIVKNREAFNLRYPEVSPDKILGEFSGSLSNDGELIELKLIDGTVVKSFEYNDKLPWPESSDGEGYSLVLNRPFDGQDHNDAKNWSASSALNGTPTVTSSSQSYADWIKSFSLDNEFSEPNADPDGDGFVNMVEYALDSSPLINSGLSNLDEISKINLDGKTFLTYSYNQRKGVDGLQFVLEVSEDMITWNSGEEYLKSIEDDKELKSEFYRRSFRSVKPVNLNQSYFFRLKIVSE